MQEMYTPIKIRQSVLEDLSPFMKKLLTPKRESEMTEVRKNKITKRGPTLQVTTPEEEKNIFQDKSDPQINSLIEGVEALGVTKNGNMASMEKEAPSVATKDDKALIKSEWWDFYLYLGLSVHAHVGPWARAARTI
jgi:hypothetical protein